MKKQNSIARSATIVLAAVALCPTVQVRADSLGLLSDVTATGVGLTVSQAFAPTFGWLASSAITLMAGIIRHDLKSGNAQVAETLHAHQEEARAALANPAAEPSPELKGLVSKTREKLTSCLSGSEVTDRDVLVLIADTDWSVETIEAAEKDVPADGACR